MAVFTEKYKGDRRFTPKSRKDNFSLNKYKKLSKYVNFN